jgi:hypothetical protein
LKSVSAFEIVAVIVLLMVGYWAISALWPRTRWHQVLGVRRDANLGDIRKSYEARLADARGDERMRAQIERAYEEALSSRDSQ